MRIIRLERRVKEHLRTDIAKIALAAAVLSIPFATAQDSPAHKQREAAIALEQAGKTTEAEAAWRTLLKVQPTSAEAYAHLGFLEAQQQRYAQAIPLYRKALALQPTMPQLRMNLGLGLFKADVLKECGKKQEAAVEFAKTKALTKAADDSVFNQLKQARQTGEVATENNR